MAVTPSPKPSLSPASALPGATPDLSVASALPHRSFFGAIGPLLWVKWRMQARTSRSKSSIWGIVLSLLFIGPAALGLAGVLGFALWYLHAPYDGYLLQGLLLLIGWIWISVPLFGFALNDSYDITRLFLYPITFRQIFTGVILGSLMEFTTYLLLPTLLGVIVAFSNGVGAALIALLIVFLFLFHILAFSQGILLFLGGLLRSRRFRDIAIVVVPLFWMLWYVGSRSGFVQQAARQVDWKQFWNGPTWIGLSWLPPGIAARAIASARHGDWPMSLGLTAAMLVITVVTVYVAGWLIQMAYIGEPVGPRRRRATATNVPAPLPAHALTKTEVAAALPVAGVGPVTNTAARRELLPPVVGAIVQKELLYMRRDPAFKVLLMNMVYLLVVVVIGIVRSRNAMGLLWGGTALLTLRQSVLMFNIWGNEGPAATLLFNLPSPRRDLLLGKNLIHLALFGGINLIFVVAAVVFLHAWELLLPFIVWALCVVTLYISIGNWMSSRFPTRVVVRNFRTGRASASSSAGYGFLYLGISLLAQSVLLPVLAAILLPMFLFGSAWYALSLPFALIYTVGLYLVSLHYAVPYLESKEHTIIGYVTQAPG